VGRIVVVKAFGQQDPIQKPSKPKKRKFQQVSNPQLSETYVMVHRIVRTVQYIEYNYCSNDKNLDMLIINQLSSISNLRC